MGFYPVPKGTDPSNLDPQAQPASQTVLRDFLAALQEPLPEEQVEAPEDLSVGDRIYYALKGAREPQYGQRVVEPMIKERETYRARKEAAVRAGHATRVKELGAALGNVTLAESRATTANVAERNAASHEMTAQAARDRVANAIKKGGKVRNMIERDSVGNPVNAPYVEDQDEDGNTILRRIEMVGPGAEGEVRTLGTPRPVTGKVIADETGKQRLVSPHTGADITPPAGAGSSLGFKSPPVGIQESAARAVSTIAGFEDMKAAYRDYQTSELGPAPSKGSRLVAQGRGKLASAYPSIQAIMDPRTLNFVRARRAALNRYIKDVTGAQFSIKELERYESQLPGPGEAPETAIPAIQALVNQSLEQLRAFIRQNGGLKAMITNPALLAQVEKNSGLSAFAASLNPTDPVAQRWIEQGTPAPDNETTASPSVPPGIPVGSIRVGRSRTTGRPLWRAPDKKLWSE